MYSLLPPQKVFFIIHTRHLQYKTACQRQSEETRNCMQYPHLPPGKFTTCLFLLSQALTNQSLYLQINTGVTIEAEEWLNKIFLKLHNLLGTVYNTKTHVLWWMHDMQKTIWRKALITSINFAYSCFKAFRKSMHSQCKMKIQLISRVAPLLGPRNSYAYTSKWQENEDLQVNYWDNKDADLWRFSLFF